MQLAVIIIFARYLSKEDFGIISIVASLLVFINIFSEIGIGPALIQRKELTIKHLQVANLSMLGIGFISYMILFFASGLIANQFDEKSLIAIIRITGISLIFTSVGNVSFSLLRRELDFKTILIMEVLAFFLSYGLVGITLILFDAGIWSYIISSVVQSFLMIIMLLYKKPIVGGLSWHQKEFSELFGFAGWLTIENVFNTIARQSDVFITGKLLGISTLGLYSRAYQIIDIPNQYIGMALDNVLFPAMSKKQDELDVVTSAFLKGVAVTNILMFPLAAFIAIYANPIITLLFGLEWVEASMCLQLLCIMLPLKTSVKIMDSLVRARGASRESSYMKFFFMAFMIVLCVFGTKWGLVGVSYGVDIAVFLHFVLMTWLAKRLLNFPIGIFFKGFIPGIVCATVIGFVNIALFLLTNYFGIQNYIVIGIGVLLTLVLSSLVFLYPSILGGTWKWLLGNLIEMLPANKRIVGVKIFLTKRIAVY